jgi:small conductance mechanosensitive channel
LILSILNDKPKVLKHPNQKFCKTSPVLLKWQCPWATSEDYGVVFTEENCKTAFDAAGIVIQPM